MLPSLLFEQRQRRCVLSDSHDGLPPAKDVRALFDKVSIGNGRYRTFSRPKPQEKTEPVAAATPVRMVEAPAPTVTHHPIESVRRALDSAFDINARMRAPSMRTHLSVGGKAAMAFASSAGGVGKTTLCATVARVLSARMANVLVADRSTEGILPFFFSLERLSAGGLQTAYPNARRPGYPMTLVAAPRSEQPIPATATWLEQLQAQSSLTLLDLPVFQGRTSPEVLGKGGVVVVVLAPDVQSVASLARAQEAAATLSAGQEFSGRTIFVLNRFQESRALHREIRSHLEQMLGDRLAPVAVRESELIPEALSLGMTVLDHAPQSPEAREFEQVATWLEQSLAQGLANEMNAEKTEIA
jgi:cellulose synthase operon protein YhjQ